MCFTYFVTEPTYDWFIRLFNKIPLFNTFYSSIKDITEAFVGDTKKFSEPVIVLVNETGLKKVGFLTQKDLQKIGLPDDRSEEHTSELQSREKLVCRLLLEKKNTTISVNNHNYIG